MDYDGEPIDEGLSYEEREKKICRRKREIGLTNAENSGIIKPYEASKANPANVVSQADSLEKEFANFVDSQNGFTSDFKKRLKEAFANGTPIAQKAFIKYATSDAIASTTNTGNYFFTKEEKIYLNAKALMNDPRGPATLFYHEFGHLVDYKSQSELNAWSSVKSKRFVKAIHKDFDKLIKNYMKANKCKNADAIEHFIDEFSKDPASVNQISDLFCGIVKIRDPRLYGHKVSYWNDQSLAKEAFAHMFECQFDTARHGLMQQYFPTALAKFEKMLGGLV